MRVLDPNPASHSDESYSIQDSEGRQEWLAEENESKAFHLQEKWSQKVSRYSHLINSANGWEHERGLEFAGDADKSIKESLERAGELLNYVEPPSQRQEILNEIEERTIEHAAEKGMLDDGIIDEHEAQELGQFIEEQVMMIEVEFDDETEASGFDNEEESYNEKGFSCIKFNKELSRIVEGLRQGKQGMNELFDQLPDEEIAPGLTAKEKMAHDLIAYFSEDADIYGEGNHQLPQALQGLYDSLSPENKVVFDKALKEESSPVSRISLEMSDEELEKIVAGEGVNAYGQPWSQHEKDTAAFILNRRGSNQESYPPRIAFIDYISENELETA